MNIKEKYDVEKRYAILLFVQMILIILGFCAQVGILIYSISNNLNGFMIVSSASIILSFISVIVYSIFGFKNEKSHFYYLAAIILFLLAVLVNNLLPFRDVTQKICLTLLFGILMSFIFTQKNYKLTNILVFIAAIVALVFSIYSLATSDINNMGQVEGGFLTVLLMVISIFTPVIMTGVFGVTYLVRKEKNK